MSLFEFIMVLSSIIVGMSLTETLSGMADSFINKNKRKFSWIHFILSIAVLMVIVQIWWEQWDFNSIDQWTLSDLFFLMMPLVLVFLIARIMNPGREFSGSMEDYYFKNASKIWILVGLLVLFGNTSRTFILGSKLLVVDNLSSLPTLFIALILGISPNRLLHTILISALLATILLDVLLINFLISI